MVPLFAPLLAHSKSPEEGAPLTQVTGMHPISKFYPPNILPKEIDTDHPRRIRALIVDSANPALSGADTQAYDAAFKKLELLVVIDVAMTETARAAHYVLPAQTQFEKGEAAFFTFGFPTSYFHIRKPILQPEDEGLQEGEIYRRLLVAMGKIPDRFPKLEAAAKLDRIYPSARLFPTALMAALKLNPKWQAYLPVILYATLGKALPPGMAPAASIWGVSQFYVNRYKKQVQRTGLKGSGYTLANALFERCLRSDRSVPLATFTYEETWRLMRTPDKRVHLYIEEMIDQLKALKVAQHDDEERAFPFILMAGERRAYNANQIFRTPDWRKTDKEGAMRMHPNDCDALHMQEGERVICRSARGAIEVVVRRDDTVQPGMLTLPHGYGMLYEKRGKRVRNGPSINELTESERSDPIAKTPYHKYVRVAVEKLT